MNKALVLLAIVACALSGICQSMNPRKRLGVISVEVKGLATDPSVVSSYLRIELDKLKRFEVVDKLEILQLIESQKLDPDRCFGKPCLLEVGHQLGCDYVFSGSFERLGKSLTVSYKLINVHTGEVDDKYVHEFLLLPEEFQSMIKLSVADMFHQPFDENLMNKLSKSDDFDSQNNNPTKTRLQLDGPRMGAVAFTGDLQQRITAPKSQGGMNCYPVMFQFGYQFEKQYLNEGRIQALFEFIPMITGLDQAKFLPSVAVLNGLRGNVNGWEIAFGPSFYFIKEATGFYDADGRWILRSEYQPAQHGGAGNQPEFIERVDSRGSVFLKSSFVLACGRTFRSGKLNLPVNFFVVPSKAGWRMGVSFGYNAK